MEQECEPSKLDDNHNELIKWYEEKGVKPKRILFSGWKICARK